MDKRKRFNKICKDIKEIKIQGAGNVARKGLYAYSLIPTQASKKKLLKLRPTEPMLRRVLELADKWDYKDIINHFDFSQEMINKQVFKLIKSKDVIFTHCHSSTVVKSLIFAKKKKFEVYNTETRPLYQGRKTARELGNAGIRVTMFVDSAVGIALSKEQGTKKANKVFLGADAILKKGVINKVGSEVISRIAKTEKIPVYILSDSWKFSNQKVPREQRKLNEVWNKFPKKIKIRNPAFEFIDKKYITGIISELGVLKYKDFLKKVK